MLQVPIRWLEVFGGRPERRSALRTELMIGGILSLAPGTLHAGPPMLTAGEGRNVGGSLAFRPKRVNVPPVCRDVWEPGRLRLKGRESNRHRGSSGEVGTFLSSRPVRRVLVRMPTGLAGLPTWPRAMWGERHGTRS